MVKPSPISNDSVPQAPETSEQLQTEALTLDVDPDVFDAPDDNIVEKKRERLKFLFPRSDGSSPFRSRSKEHELGLDINLPWGWSGSEYDDYDVITVHGIRDDYKTSWIDKQGAWWVKDQLFKDLSIREIDYSYEIDEESMIYKSRGIFQHAHILINEYLKVRKRLMETETDRPIIWICHDLGGTIVKEAISVAMNNPAMYGKIPILTTAIIFLGTPHCFNAIDDLEGQLHNLITLPGPEIKDMVISKTKKLASQVDEINERFLATKILDRVVMFNVFSRANDNRTEDDPPDPVTPFATYVHFMGQAFEIVGQLGCRYIDHLDLIRGDRNTDWVSAMIAIFNTSGSSLRVNYRILNHQATILSLAPPTRVVDVSRLPSAPLVEWVYEREAFKAFSRDGTGPRLMHFHANGQPSFNISEISRCFYHGYDCESPFYKSIRRPNRSVIYFEFDQWDSRYSTISSLLTYLINIIVWRFWEGNSSLINDELTFLNELRSWSLEDLYHLYNKLRNGTAASDLVIFISCFDQCPLSQRQWFLQRVLEQQDYCEATYKMIISTWTLDGLAIDSFPEEARINFEDCLVASESIDQLTEISKSGLSNLLLIRPIYQDFQSRIESLLEQCGDAPYLRCIILTWLQNNLRGRPKSMIANKISELLPPTTQRIVRVIISSLRSDVQIRAKNVFNWVKHALEPWDPKSLVSALVIYESCDDEPSLGDIDFEETIDEIQKALSGIITIEKGCVKFSHPSFYCVPEIDVEGDPEERVARVNGTMAEICLRCFHLKEIQEILTRFSRRDFQDGPWATPLDTVAMSYSRDSIAVYAIRLWPQHYRASGAFKPSKLVHKLFASKEARAAWEVSSWLMENPYTRMWRSYISTLPVLAMLGLGDLVEEMTRTDHRLPSFNKNCWMAITEAARVGNEEIVRMLLKQVTIDVEELRTAIDRAAACGNNSITSLLIERIPDPKTFEWPENIIFQVAATKLNNILTKLPLSGLVNKASPLWGAPPLGIAAWRGHVSTVELLLKSDQKPDLTIKDFDGDPIIAFAADQGNPRIVEMLLQNGASLALADQNGKSPVCEALYGGMNKALDALIKGGAEFKKGNEDGRPPLVLAAVLGLVDCARILLDHGADPNAECESGTALYAAISGNYLDVARLLLERNPKSDMSVAPLGEPTLFIRAVYTGNTEFVSLLIEHGVKVDFVDPNCSFSQTPLSRACKEGDLPMVKMLLEKGADINYTGGSSDTPLLTSLVEQKLTVAEYLLQVENVDVHWKDSNGMGSLHAAVHLPTIVPKLLKMGVSTNISSVYGSPLHMAARNGYHESMEALLENDPKSNLDFPLEGNAYGSAYGSQAIGCTPFQLACMFGYPECIKALMRAGANARYENKGIDAIDIIFQMVPPPGSSKNMARECLTLLLSEPCNVPIEHANTKGPTRLHNINENTSIGLVQALVEAKALLDIPDANRCTPLVVAINENNESVAKYLVEQGASVNLFSPIYGSVLHLAVSKGMLDLVRLLVKSVTDVETVDPKYGKSLLYAALSISDDRKLREMVWYLVEELKVSVNKRGGDFGYPIILAANIGGDLGLRLIKFFIHHKVQVDVADIQGRRAIHLVSMWPEEDGIRVLEEAGAELDAKDKFGRMPIHFAASTTMENCMKYLLDKCKDSYVNVADNDDWTPLLWAARSGGKENIKELISRDANALVCGRAYDAKAEWSALKLMNFTDNHTELIEELKLKERMGIDQHDEEPELVKHGHKKLVTCASCLVSIVGIQWACISCTHEFSLCFKCFGYRSTIHDPDHIFQDTGPLYDDSPLLHAEDTLMSEDFDPEIPEAAFTDGI